jgi:tetratricopeptide (TPR) repeat protein
LLLGRGRALAEQRELPLAREDAEEVLEASDDPTTTARSLSLLADIEQMEGSTDQSILTFDRALVLWRELGDEHGVAEALRGRGITAMFMGDLDAADSQIAEALELFRHVGDRRGEAWALQNLATISFFRGDAERAEVRLTAAGEMFRELGDWGGLNWSLAIMAWVRFMQGRLDEAERVAREQLPESDASGNRWVSGILSVLLGNVALWSGRPDTAVDHARDAVARFSLIGDAWGETQARVVLARALAASGRIDDGLGEIEIGLDEGVQANYRMASGVRSFVRAQVLVHCGDAEALPAALHTSGGVQGMQLDVELQTMLGLALLQSGKIDEALAELDEAWSKLSGSSEGPSANVRSARSLALAAAGRTAEARSLSEDGVGKGTYLDQQWCELAGAFTLLQAGSPDAVDAFDAALEHVDATEARLDQATVRLARVQAMKALDAPGVDDAESDLQRTLAALGRDLPGWTRVFTLASRRP